MRGLRITAADKTTAANQFQAYSDLVRKSAGQSTLLIVNKIYVNGGTQLNKDFRDVAIEKFSSGIESLNFTNSGESAQIVNRFVEKITNDKIKNLASPAMFGEHTLVVLVNAIYFKGDWLYKFREEDNTMEDFHLNETEDVYVEFMNIRGTFNCTVLKDLDAKALEIKYANSDLTFMIVLPNSLSGLTAVESKLRNYNMSKITGEMHPCGVDLTIPKFKIEFGIDLKEVLTNVCMQTDTRVTFLE